MGSLSDHPVLVAAELIFKEFEVAYDIQVVSAHRTPKKMVEYASNARGRGIKVIIACAGGAAHLPGMVASLTTLPVIGVPAPTESLKGIDSLYSIVQMPPGIPVATVGINAGTNAALLAVRILSLADESLAKKLVDYAKKLESKVGEMNLELHQK